MTNIKKKLLKKYCHGLLAAMVKMWKSRKQYHHLLQWKAMINTKKYKKTLPRFITTMAIKKIKKGLKG